MTKEPRGEFRLTEIPLRLLGPLHDRVHHLTYRGVERYSVRAQLTAHGHGDLLVHEIRLGDEGLVEHELLFAGGAVVETAFAEFEHRTLPVATV